jgi:hypothetical protein
LVLITQDLPIPQAHRLSKLSVYSNNKVRIRWKVGKVTVYLRVRKRISSPYSSENGY